jgi:hypothetical protein
VQPLYVPVHVDDGGGDGDAHAEGSRDQAAAAADLYLQDKKPIYVQCTKYSNL